MKPKVERGLVSSLVITYINFLAPFHWRAIFISDFKEVISFLKTRLLKLKEQDFYVPYKKLESYAANDGSY